MLTSHQLGWRYLGRAAYVTDVSGWAGKIRERKEVLKGPLSELQVEGMKGPRISC